MPWNAALLDAVGKLEARLKACQAENAQLQATVHRQKGQLHDARRRLENWRLRQEAWREERAELLRKSEGFSSS